METENDRCEEVAELCRVFINSLERLREFLDREKDWKMVIDEAVKKIDIIQRKAVFCPLRKQVSGAKIRRGGNGRSVQLSLWAPSQQKFTFLK